MSGSLTDEEKILIARRAGGEYAVIDRIRKLVSSHRKNRNPEDEVYLSFARLSVRQSFSWDDYEEKAKAVLELIPRPWSPLATPGEPRKQKKTKRPKRKGAAGLMDLLDD